jgi:hypothetical protein
VRGRSSWHRPWLGAPPVLRPLDQTQVLIGRVVYAHPRPHTGWLGFKLSPRKTKRLSTSGWYEHRLAGAAPPRWGDKPGGREDLAFPTQYPQGQGAIPGALLAPKAPTPPAAPDASRRKTEEERVAPNTASPQCCALLLEDVRGRTKALAQRAVYKCQISVPAVPLVLPRRTAATTHSRARHSHAPRASPPANPTNPPNARLLQCRASGPVSQPQRPAGVLCRGIRSVVFF